MRYIVIGASVGLVSTIALGLGSGAAKAADVAVAPSDWSGFYAGIHAGFATGFNSSLETLASEEGFITGSDISVASTQPSLLGVSDIDRSNNDHQSFLAGINAGYNLQHGAIVFGVEADLSAMSGGTEDLTSSSSIASPMDVAAFDDLVNGGSYGYMKTVANGEFGLSNLVTLRARLGYDIDGTWLPFITGGLAWGQVSTEGSVNYSGDSDGRGGFNETFRFGDKSWEMGWTLGGGVNYRVAENAFIGVTYLYTDLGEHDFSHTYRNEDYLEKYGNAFEGSVKGEVDASFHTVRFSFDVMF
jgi:outer membrane immunogenic protein